MKGLERVCAGFAGHPAPYQPGLHVRRRVPRGLGAHDLHLLGRQIPNPERPAARPERAAPSAAMLLKGGLPSVWSNTRLPRSTAVFWLQGCAALNARQLATTGQRGGVMHVCVGCGICQASSSYI